MEGLEGLEDEVAVSCNLYVLGTQVGTVPRYAILTPIMLILILLLRVHCTSSLRPRYCQRANMQGALLWLHCATTRFHEKRGLLYPIRSPRVSPNLELY